VAAEEWLLGFQARRAMELIDSWLDRRAEADPQWVAVADQSDYWLRMAPDQVKAMADEVHAVVQRHIDAAKAAPLSPDAMLARVFLFVVPDDEGPGPGPAEPQ
jgi:hypothetical protein